MLLTYSEQTRLQLCSTSSLVAAARVMLMRLAWRPFSGEVPHSPWDNKVRSPWFVVEAQASVAELVLALVHGYLLPGPRKQGQPLEDIYCLCPAPSCLHHHSRQKIRDRNMEEKHKNNVHELESGPSADNAPTISGDQQEAKVTLKTWIVTLILSWGYGLSFIVR